MPRICPEAELLLLCGWHKPSAEKIERLREILRAGLDWDYLIKSAGDHKMIPLLYRRLITTSKDLVPGDVLEKLRSSNYFNAGRNLSLTRELFNVIDRLEDQSIPVMTFKGPILASSVYGDLFLRQFDDLDILIPPAKIADADKLLLSMGYQGPMPNVGKISSAQEAAMLKYEHHHHFYNRVSKVHLEVHWRLSPKLYSLHQDTAPLWERAEQVDLENRKIMGLSSEDTLVLICDHATRHHWNRLAWICDVAMLLGSKSLNWNVVMEQATEWRSKRILLLGLFLSKGLLGAPLPNDVDRIVMNDRPVRALASEVVNHLFHNGSASVEFSSDPALRNIQYQLFYIKARERFLDRARLRLRWVTTPTSEDWNFVSLPDRLFPFYHLIRPMRQANAYKLKILSWLFR